MVTIGGLLDWPSSEALRDQFFNLTMPLPCVRWVTWDKQVFLIRSDFPEVNVCRQNCTLHKAQDSGLSAKWSAPMKYIYPLLSASGWEFCNYRLVLLYLHFIVHLGPEILNIEICASQEFFPWEREDAEEKPKLPLYTIQSLRMGNVKHLCRA